MSKTISLEEAREQLSRIGRTPVDVAKELGVSVQIVRGVLDGRLQGVRGDAHKVSVALLLKEGLIVDDKLPIAEAMKAAAA